MTLYRRGRISRQEAERQLDDIGRETEVLHEMVDALQPQADPARAFETQVSEAAAMLTQLRDRIEGIERTDDSAMKRMVAELLVDGIIVHTVHDGNQQKGEITVRYTFGRPTVPDSRTRPPSAPRCPARRGA